MSLKNGHDPRKVSLQLFKGPNGNWQTFHIHLNKVEDGYVSQSRNQTCGYCGTYGNGEHVCVPMVQDYMANKNRKGNTNMANVVICDVCGTVTAGAAAGSVEYTPNPDSEIDYYTLCAGCSEDVYDVLHGKDRVTPVMRGFDPSQRTQTVVNQADTTRAALEAEYGDNA